MPDYNFFRDFIEGFEARQNAERRKFDLQRSRRVEAEEVEDRDIEKKLLQHRLQEIKVQDMLRQREAAKFKLDTLSGRPESDFPIKEGETERVTEFAIPGEVPPEGMAQRDIPSVQFPGIAPGMLGDQSPGMEPWSVKPVSMEQMLANEIAKRRATALATPRTVGRGGRMFAMNPDTGEMELVAEGQEYVSAGEDPDRMVWTTTRDAQGRTTRVLRRQGDITGQEFTQEPIPRQTTQGLGPEIFESIAEGITSGQIPVDFVPRSAVGMRALGLAGKKGFNAAEAALQLRAAREYISTMNAPQIQAAITAHDSTIEALTKYKEAVAKYNSGGWGALGIGAAKLRGGPEAMAANELESAAANVIPMVAQIRSRGSNPSNDTLAAVQSELGATRSAKTLATVLDQVIADVTRRRNSITAATVRGIDMSDFGVPLGSPDFGFGPPPPPGAIRKPAAQPQAGQLYQNSKGEWVLRQQ